jgi:hypothetical protein
MESLQDVYFGLVTSRPKGLKIQIRKTDAPISGNAFNPMAPVFGYHWRKLVVIQRREASKTT